MDEFETELKTEYPLATKYAAIFAADLNGVPQAAREIGVPRRTIRDWVDKRDELGVPKELALSVAKERLENKAGSIMDDCLEIIEKASAQVKVKLGEVNAVQAATIMGIYTDKAFMLNNLLGAKDNRKDNLTDEQKQRMILDAAAVIERAKAVEITDYESIEMDGENADS